VDVRGRLGYVVSNGIYLHKYLAALGGAVLAGEADHKNRDKLDCRLSNLRPATRRQNILNKPKKQGASSRYHGVNVDPAGQFIARLDGKYLGYFSDELTAAIAYNRARLLLPPEIREFVPANRVADDGRALPPRRTGNGSVFCLASRRSCPRPWAFAVKINHRLRTRFFHTQAEALAAQREHAAMKGEHA